MLKKLGYITVEEAFSRLEQILPMSGIDIHKLKQEDIHYLEWLIFQTQEEMEREAERRAIQRKSSWIFLD